MGNSASAAPLNAAVVVGVLTVTLLAAGMNFNGSLMGGRVGIIELTASLVALVCWMVASAVMGWRGSTAFLWFALTYWLLVAVSVSLFQLVGLNLITFLVLGMTSSPWYAFFDRPEIVGLTDSVHLRMALIGVAGGLACATAWLAGRRRSTQRRVRASTSSTADR